MILSYFGYKEPGWELIGLSPLKSVNLLVARNATGKTRTIRALQNVTSFMQMKEILWGIRTFEADLKFVDVKNTDWEMYYSFKINDGIVEKEQLTVNGVTLIKRTKTTAKYENKIINPPAEKLVVQIRRDKDLYPEIEQLMVWAEGVTSFSCSDINPISLPGTGKFINPYSFSELVEALSHADIKKVLTTAKKLGYHLANINTIEAMKGIRLVQIKEKSVSNEMVDMQLSSGMIRTLYLLCFVSVIKHYKKLSMLLIDDMGEGLDYHRSIDLGKIIFEDCEKNGLQLIAGSNDAFLMDVVDIANWQILRRKGSKVSSINQMSHPDLFRNFRMTGLSNFDLFSSDFIDSYLNREKCSLQYM
ncbi:MAG: hypothetical protein ACI3ZZ_06280 [Candidatus Aphodosoma sp.]